MPVSILRFTVGELELQVCTNTPGFMYTLVIRTQVLVHILPAEPSPQQRQRFSFAWSLPSRCQLRGKQLYVWQQADDIRLFFFIKKGPEINLP